ncbi:MAG TPA: PH domain-containing protein [Tepidisphaeraceae bacterium]|nr:PH domain-containing protein [Tepidisphaeraceae bacterium]
MSGILKRSEQATAISPACNTAGAAPAVPAVGAASPLAALLTRHIFQDGEIILLILKPSIFFIVLSMLRSAAVVLILMIAAVLFDAHLPGQPRSYVEAGACILAARFMWSVLQWTSRLYVLTDMRLVSLSGVLALDIFDCPLRKVARTRVFRSMRERLFGLGSIEIIPSDENLPITLWQTVSNPLAVNDQIVAAMNRAKQGRCES